MPCVECNRPKKVQPIIPMEQGEAFLCWYCRAHRIASAAKHLLNTLDSEHRQGELEDSVGVLERELQAFHYAGKTIAQLKKPIKGLEGEDRKET